MPSWSAQVRVTVGLVTVLAMVGSVFAQRPRDSVLLEIGFGGEIVANRWNPLRLTVRDQPNAVLEIVMDQGSLRQGEVPMIYRAVIGGGTGTTVFEDDIFVPAWRQLSWTVSRAGAVLASGSLSSRERDERLLNLLVTRQPGAWRGLFDPDDRVTEVAAPALPGRAASYNGVNSLLVDGTAAAPRTTSVAAAAAAGTTVRLVPELPPSHRDLELLAPPGVHRLGAGWLIRADPAAPQAFEIGRTLLATDLLTILDDTTTVAVPPHIPQMFVMVAAAVYAILMLVMVRFFGTPGILAALSLTLLVSLASWRALRPAAALIETSFHLELASGDLAYRLGLRKILTLPAGPVTVGAAVRPDLPRTITITPDATEFSLPRWHQATLIDRPRVVPASLVWNGALLENRSALSFPLVVVKGLGPQPELHPGQTLIPRPGEDQELPSTLRTVLNRVPVGSAVAVRDSHLFVAFPDAVLAAAARLW